MVLSNEGCTELKGLKPINHLWVLLYATGILGRDTFFKLYRRRTPYMLKQKGNEKYRLNISVTETEVMHQKITLSIDRLSCLTMFLSLDTSSTNSSFQMFKNIFLGEKLSEEQLKLLHCICSQAYERLFHEYQPLNIHVINVWVQSISKQRGLQMIGSTDLYHLWSSRLHIYIF